MKLTGGRARFLWLLAGIVFILVCCLAVTGQAATAAPEAPAAVDTPTETPACTISRIQADYGQHYDGINITPLERHDEDGARL